jgi:hypothetical protein
MKNKSVYIMIAALLWLTVSLPFVYQAHQHLKGQLEFSTNTTEEKTESGSSSFSEYLHEAHAVVQPAVEISQIFKCHSTDLFIAYHPDYFSPPPERGSSAVVSIV